MKPKRTLADAERDLAEMRECLAKYRRMTRFVWKTMVGFRALVRAGCAGAVSEAVAAYLAANPAFAVCVNPGDPHEVARFDFPARSIHIPMEHPAVMGAAHG